MTSSSSLYGTVTQQNVSSANSTGLYGDAGTPIPDSSGNVIVRGTLTVNGCAILTNCSSFSFLPLNATSIGIGASATTIGIGANTGTTTVNNDLDVTGDLIVNGTFVAPNAEFGNITIAVVDDNTISTTTGNLVLDSATGIVNAKDIQASAPVTGLNLYNNDATNAIHIYDNFVQISSGTIPGADWAFNEDGTTTFPGYSFPYLDGTANQVLATDGSGNLAWTSVQSLDTNYTIDASATSGGANFNLQGSDATTDTIKFAEGTGISVVRTNANVITFTNTGIVDPYDIDATATTGGANLNLNNALGTDTVKFADSTHITATATGPTQITLAVDATNANTASTIVARDASGNFSAGTGSFTGVKIDGSTNGSSTFTAPATGSVLSYVLPGTSGAASTVLTNDGSGNLTWALPGGGGSTFGNITVAVVDDNTISTTSGNLVLDSATNVVNVNARITTTEIQGATAGAYPAAGLNLYSNNLNQAIQLDDTDIQLTVNGRGWILNADGTTQFPDYKFPYLDGTADQILITDGSGSLSFTSNPIFAGGTFGNITVAVVDDNTISTTSGNLALTATGSNGVTIDSGTTAPTLITRNSTATASSIRSLALAVQSSGTPTVGFGNTLDFQLEAQPGNTELAGFINVVSTDLTPGSEDFTMSFGLMQNGSAYTSKMSLTSAGDLTLDGGIRLSGSTSGSSIFSAPATGSVLSYVLPGAAGATDSVLTNDGSGNLTWALPGGGGSTFGNVSIGVDTDQTISTTSGNLVLQTAAGVDSGTITIFSGAGGNIAIAPDTTGDIHLNSDAIRIGDNNATATLATRGTGNLVLTTHEGSAVEGTLTFANGANGNATFAPNGTGNVATTFNNGGNLTNNRNYVFGAIRNATTAAAGDVWNFNTTGLVGPLRGISLDNSGDTTKNPGQIIRSYSGSAATGQRPRLVFEKARNTVASPSANAAADVLGGIDATGYSSTGWVNDTISAAPGNMVFVCNEAWVSNTNLGTGFVMNLAPTATTISTAANLVQALNINPQTNQSRSDNFTWGSGKSATTFSATGSSISSTTLTIGTVTAGTVAVGQFVQTATLGVLAGTYIVSNISGSGSGSTWVVSQGQTVGSTTITGTSGGMYLNSSSNLDVLGNAMVRGTSIQGVNLGTTYANINTGSATFTNTGINNFIRQGSTGAQVPALLIRYQRTDQTGSQNNDGVDFRLSTGGTSTSDNIARFDAVYKSSGDNEIGMSVSADSFVTDTDRIYVGSRAKTIIRATPSGGGATSDMLVVEQTKITMGAPVAFPVYTAAALNAITGAVGWQASVSNSPTVGGRMAFWDTTNARWSYISDNSAV